MKDFLRSSLQPEAKPYYCFVCHRAHEVNGLLWPKHLRSGGTIVDETGDDE